MYRRDATTAKGAVVETGRNVRGVVLALISGALWGFSGACAQFLFMRYQADPLWVTTFRITVGGLVIMAFTLFTQRKGLLGVWKRPRDVVHLFAVALISIVFMQIAYLEAIQASNAATATVFEYIGPVIVVVFMCIRGRRLPTKYEVAAIILVMVGTFLLATHANPFALVLSPRALLWGALAAISIACYTLIPPPLMDRYGNFPVLAWGMIIGAVVMTACVRPWTIPTSFDANGWFALIVGLTLLGTVAAYLTFYQSIKDIGASRSSLLSSVETISAAAFSVLWLGTQLTVYDYVGIAFIVCTVFVLARNQEPNAQARSNRRSRNNTPAFHRE
jgi:drug/metabolite transporter (DMT)-like permease